MKTKEMKFNAFFTNLFLVNLSVVGVCLGLQSAVIEFARNVLGWHNANSTEFDPNTQYPVVSSAD